MDYRRIFLYIALAIVGFSLWTSWLKDYKATPKRPTTAEQAQKQAEGLPPVALTKQPPATKAQAAPKKTPKGRVIHVHTDVLNVAIDTVGGDIVGLSLPKYPKAVKTPEIPEKILTDSPTDYYISQSGLIGKDGPDTEKGQALYSTQKKVYRLKEGEDTLTVDLRWKNAEGLDVVKSFTFHRGKYVFDVSYKVDNQTKKTWTGNFYSQIKRKRQPGGGIFHLHTYNGAALSSPEKSYEKISYSTMDKGNLSRKIKGGWYAMQQRYFLSAWVPNENQINHYYTRVSPNKIYTIGFVGPQLRVKPGASLNTGAKLYVGPEVATKLQQVTPHLEMTIDYGWLWIISMAIFWVMKHIYNEVGNWGWSIVLVTVLIKLMFYKLSQTSYRSMAKMRRLQPRIATLKERYGDDKQAMSKATMELYRKEKVNPLGGCLPIIIQIPVFIALYYVLAESVQLRQASFIFWIHDLSAKDPYFVLPVLMGLSMFLQQKISPAPPDPTQAKLMMFLPVIFTVFFATFPSGLVLYWLVNNLLSILQQWHVMRSFERSQKKLKTQPKKKMLKQK